MNNRRPESASAAAFSFPGTLSSEKNFFTLNADQVHESSPLRKSCPVPGDSI